jgi:transcriptional regulator with XRE-family HTH domain
MDIIENEIIKTRKILSINMKRLRKSNLLSQEKLALEAGVDRTVVSKIEREVTNPTVDILIKLAFHLNVPLFHLFI